MKKETKQASQVNVERELPHDAEAERSILGGIILDDKTIHDVAVDLVANDFFFPHNRLIFASMLQLVETNRPIDPVLLIEELQRAGTLDRAGGFEYVIGLTDGLPKVSNIPFYVKAVKEKSVLRNIIYTANSIQTKAFTQDSDARKIADEATQLFSTLGMSTGTSLCVTRKEASISLLGRLDTAQDSKILCGVPVLDDVLGGFYPGELIVYVAKPGVGKSFLALQTSTTCCQLGEHGLYCSGEMPAEQLMARELVSASGIEPYKIRKPSALNADDFALLANAATKECGTCQILSGNLTLGNIRRSGRAMKDRGHLRFMVVDYDELVEVRGAKDEWEAQAIVSAALKTMAMEWMVPVIVISQLRKNLSNEDFPTLDDLYGSGRKAKDSSIVVYISRPYVKNLEGDETEAKIFVLKSRDGRMGAVDCKFNIKTFRFENLPPDAQEKIFNDPPRKSRRRRKQEDDDV